MNFPSPKLITKGFWFQVFYILFWKLEDGGHRWLLHIQCFKKFEPWTFVVFWYLVDLHIFPSSMEILYICIFTQVNCKEVMGICCNFKNKIGSFDNDVYKSQKIQNPPQIRCEMFSFSFLYISIIVLLMFTRVIYLCLIWFGSIQLCPISIDYVQFVNLLRLLI